MIDCYGTLIDWEAGAIGALAWVRRNGRSARLLTEARDLQVPDLQSLLGVFDTKPRVV